MSSNPPLEPLWRDLIALLSIHSVQNRTGVANWVTADFLIRSLDAFIQSQAEAADSRQDELH